MVKEKNYGYFNKGDYDGIRFKIDKGQVVAGYTIGVLLIDVWYPLMPGNVVNASTYDYPVRHKLIPGSVQTRVHGGDPTLVDDIIAAGRELERDGVRAICGACGYLGNFQKQVSSALDVPVYMSSLIQAPWIKAGLKPEQKVGIICADGPSFTPKLMDNVGITHPEDIVVKGVGHLPEFSSILLSDRGHFDHMEIERELTAAAREFVAEHPEIGAILLECSDMPPYAAAVQKAVNLPVYDFITMINWVHNSVSQHPYYGFI